MIIFILTLVSALGLWKFLPAGMSKIEKFLIIPSLGLIIFGTCSLYLSFLRISGLNNIFITFFLIVLANLFLLKGNLNKIKIDKIALKEFFLSDKLFLIFLSVLLIIFGITILNQTLRPTKNGLQTGGGGMYGDTALHAAYTSKLLEDKFPPDNPLFAGHTLVYPFANDLLSADLIKGGFNFNFAFSLPQIIFFGGFLTLFYCLAKKSLKNSWAILPIVIFLFGWGIGFSSFIGENNISQLANLKIDRDYTNNNQLNLNFHNPITGLILPERSFLPGLVIGLLVLVLLDESQRQRSNPKLVLLGILLGSLPFWHTHTFIFVSLYISFTLVFQLITKKTLPLKGLAIIFISSLPFVLPFLYLFFVSREGGSFLHYTLGWMNNGQNLLVYWFRNSFLVLPLAIAGLFFEKRRFFEFFGAFLIFIVSNVVIFQPWDWDNIKLLTWSFLLFSILVSRVIVKIIHISKIGFVVGFLIIIFLLPSGFLSILLQLKNEYIAYDNSDLELATWVKGKTNKDDVFIIEPNPTHPIPGLTGRSVYMGYPGHLWVHGINYSYRESMNSQIINGDWTNINKLDSKINYIAMPASVNKSNTSLSSKVFSNAKYKVFKIN